MRKLVVLQQNARIEKRVGVFGLKTIFKIDSAVKWVKFTSENRPVIGWWRLEYGKINFLNQFYFFG